MGAAALGLELVKMRRDRNRFIAAEQRLDGAEERLAAQDEVQLLLRLRGTLARLETAALKHLFVPGVSGAAEDVRSLGKEARFLAERAPWDDVRQTSLGALGRCGDVDRKRGDPLYENKVELRDEIEAAMRAADDVIGRRIDSFAELQVPPRRSKGG